MRAGTGRRSARARGKKVRNRKTFRQTTTPQRNQIRKTASTHGGRFLFLAGCTKGRNAGVGSPQAGMIPDPCRGGAGGVRKPGTRAGDTQIGDTEAHRTETRRTETRGHADAETQMGPQPAKMRQIRKTPYPTSSRNSARCVHYKQKARSQKRPGPVLMYGAATLRRQRAPRLRQPTHTTSNRCTHRQARHMPQAPKRLPAPRRARA